MEHLTPEQFESLHRLCISEAILYGLVLCAIMHNVYKYCFLQGRYKVVTVFAFYLLGTVIVVCRLVQFYYLILDAGLDQSVQHS